MSRHRFIKTMDIDEELDDFEGDGDIEEDYNYDEDPQMQESLTQAKAVLGNTFSDREIQDSLWYTYYDVDQTVDYLLSRLDS